MSMTLTLLDDQGELIKSVVGDDLEDAAQKMWLEVRCEHGPLSVKPRDSGELFDSIYNALGNDFEVIMDDEIN
jgi:hypothetical protein